MTPVATCRHGWMAKHEAAMAGLSPKTSGAKRGRGRAQRASGHGSAAMSWLLVILILAAVGGLAAVAVVTEAKGAQYRATVDVRSATTDATCVYFGCEQPASAPQASSYVAGQANAILSPTLASQVADRRSTPSSAQLLSHVCAKEIGSSSTIAVCYVASSRQKAQAIAADYAEQYVHWSNAQAVGSLTTLDASLTRRLDASRSGGRPGSADRGLKLQLQAVRRALRRFQRGHGPDGARIRNVHNAQVSRMGSTLGPAEAGALGAAAGSVLAIGLLLMVPPLLRRPDTDTDRSATGAT